MIEIISKWSPIGQGIFFLIILGGLYSMLIHLAFYLSVAFKGWPDRNTQAVSPEED